MRFRENYGYNSTKQDYDSTDFLLSATTHSMEDIFGIPKDADKRTDLPYDDMKRIKDCLAEIKRRKLLYSAYMIVTREDEHTKTEVVAVLPTDDSRGETIDNIMKDYFLSLGIRHKTAKIDDCLFDESLLREVVSGDILYDSDGILTKIKEQNKDKASQLENSLKARNSYCLQEAIKQKMKTIHN